MLCFVCFQFSEKTSSVFGDKYLQYRISEIIEKHLCVKPQLEEESCAICDKCWTKLKEFHDFYEYVTEVHNAHVKALEENTIVVVEDSKCDDDDQIGVVDIKEESLEENDIEESPFLETEEMLSQNPLLDLVANDNVIKSDGKKSKKFKTKFPKQTIGKKQTKRKKQTPTETQYQGEDTKNTNNKSKELLLKKTRRQKGVQHEENKACNSLQEETDKVEGNIVPTESAASSHCSTKQPKRRKGHILLQENEDLIKKHIKMSCGMCTDASEDFQNLMSHFKLHHPGVKPHIKCCDRKLDCPSDILQHAYYHEDPEYFKCNECGKSFINKSGLRDHYLQYHEPEENLPYGCDQCPRRFSRKNLLEHHKSKHIPKTERSHFCDICKPTRAFANEYILQLHIKCRHTNPTNICHVCAKEIRDKQAFEKHVRLHFETSGPRLKCPREGCDSWLKDEDNLRQHLRRFHDAQQYECPQCRRICKNKHSLSCHLKNTHTTKTYTCEECQKSFKSQQSLKEHMAGHTGEALYNCPFCSRTFNSKANMYSHKKKAHPTEWELWHQTKIGSKT